jgi:hypothetical protein
MSSLAPLPFEAVGGSGIISNVFGNFARQPPRQIEHVHLRQRMRAGVVEQCDFARVVPEPILCTIGHHQRQPLAAPLFLRLSENIVALGRKGDAEWRIRGTATVVRMSSVGISATVTGASDLLTLCSYVASGVQSSGRRGADCSD